jgi:hypothetical protein
MADTTTEKEQKKGLLKKYLDNTFGDEGLKTDVKITLTTDTVLKAIGGGLTLIILGSFSFYMIRGLFIKSGEKNIKIQ